MAPLPSPRTPTWRVSLALSACPRCCYCWAPPLLSSCRCQRPGALLSPGSGRPRNSLQDDGGEVPTSPRPARPSPSHTTCLGGQGRELPSLSVCRLIPPALGTRPPQPSWATRSPHVPQGRAPKLPVRWGWIPGVWTPALSHLCDLGWGADISGPRLPHLRRGHIHPLPG